MAEFFQDIRHGFRRLLRKPGFTVITLIMLMLGIGANTVIFSVLRTVLFEPFPYEEPHQLVRMWENNLERGWEYFSTSEINCLDFRELNRSFEEFAAFGGVSLNLTESGDAVRLNGGRATANLFPMLGIEPVLGRLFQPEEDVPGGKNQVVLLTHRLWQESFGGDSGIVGETLTLNGQPFTVIGVLPAGEYWLEWFDLYVPLAPGTNQMRGDHRIAGMGRLKSGVGINQVRDDMDAIALSLGEQYPDSNGGWGVRLETLDTWLIPDQIRTAIWVLMGAVGFVLLIACANLTNLLLARVMDRQKEIAIYTALGAGRARLIRQVLTEAVLLSLIGGGLGVITAVWGVDLLRAFDPAGIPRVSQISVSTGVLFFTLIVSISVGILSGFIPARQIIRSNVSDSLKESGISASASSRQRRTRNIIVVAEVGLSLMLLVGAGLMIRSFMSVLAVDSGFDTSNRLTVQLNIPPTDDSSGAMRIAFYREMIDGLNSLPGVISSAAVNILPFTGGNTAMDIDAEGKPDDAGSANMSADWRLITPEYFESMGIPILSGRVFTYNDDWSEEQVVVISNATAQLLWPEENAVGKRALLWADPDRIATIIGVVGDLREQGLEGDLRRAVYLPAIMAGWPDMGLVIHTAGDPMTVISGVREVMREIDSDLPLSSIQSMEEIADQSVAARRFNMFLMTVFAAIALILAAAGIYGVMAYSVSQRLSEIGIRMALGAHPSTVLAMIVKQGMVLVVIGVGIGLVGSLLIGRLMSRLLFGVTTSDPITLIGVALGLSMIALLSTYMPARRATQVNPVTALRVD